MSDVDYNDEAEAEEDVPPKKDDYGSRAERWLYENPNGSILITYAGKNLEGGGGYISYTINTGVWDPRSTGGTKANVGTQGLEVRRRYSDFASLRKSLVDLHPTLVIPPIPEKHTMADYAAKPTKAKEDAGIIELRKRMLAVFLNRCKGMKEVMEDGVFWRFLDPNASWVRSLSTVTFILSAVLTRIITERSPPKPPACEHSQKYPESPSTRHRKSHSSS